MTIADAYLEKIQTVYPQLDLQHLELNQDGMNNDIVIVNQKLVCRFPKTDWAKADLKQEVQILQMARPLLDLPIPDLEHIEEDFVSYPLISGEPLSKNLLFKLDASVQEKVIEQLGQFLQQLHSISSEGTAASPLPPSIAERTPEDLLALYEQVQQILFPYLWKHQQTWVHEHFQPLVNGTLDFQRSSALIHGDLGCYHILFDPERQCLSGIIDFGTAGIGHPAIDLAALLDTHGEAVLKRMAQYYPITESLIDQARFRAGTVWLQWALMGIQHQDTELFLAHIGSSARDIQPLGTSW
ncbi:MAG: phosphotransferase [Oculatellaceae cyanobacterium Prado106]|jgi:aminoglycoside phosphotransferase (APT) family kinase protein|nr:phosphotransferase [Oculatellaceae cyanobacterium Prado106]